jgi:hypothetical protein
MARYNITRTDNFVPLSVACTRREQRLGTGQGPQIHVQVLRIVCDHQKAARAKAQGIVGSAESELTPELQ